MCLPPYTAGYYHGKNAKCNQDGQATDNDDDDDICN